MSFIGERSPVLSDRANLPYTMSVITELLRIDIARRSLLHYSEKDVVIQGHTIPKGKLVLLISSCLKTANQTSFLIVNKSRFLVLLFGLKDTFTYNKRFFLTLVLSHFLFFILILIFSAVVSRNVK